MQKSVSPAVIAICIIVLVVVVAALGWYFLGRKSRKADTQMPPNPMETMGAGAQQKLAPGGGSAGQPTGPPPAVPSGQ